MAFQKIFHFNTSTNQQLENFLCVTESSHQKGFHLAQKGRFIVVQPIPSSKIKIATSLFIII